AIDQIRAEVRLFVLWLTGAKKEIHTIQLGHVFVVVQIAALAQIHDVLDVRLFDVRKHVDGPGELRDTVPAGGELTSRRVMVVEGHAELPTIIQTLRPAGGFAGRLDGRQEQRDQHADDGDHHQQFHKGETPVTSQLAVATN